MHSVNLLRVGESEIPGPELFWMSDFGEWFPLAFQVVLIRSRDVVALINTGPPADLTSINERWATFLGERAALRRRPGEFILEHLERVDIQPEDVTHVILTPLQLYTVANVMAFPNAQILMSKRGWVHYHTTHHHHHDDRATSIPDEILIYLVTTAWPRVRLLEDEDSVVPGVRTWWAGTHHRASIAVEIDTNVGTAVVSDAFFWARNVEANHPIGINESLEEASIAYERARRIADALVPLYDPANFDRYKDGIVAS